MCLTRIQTPKEPLFGNHHDISRVVESLGSLFLDQYLGSLSVPNCRTYWGNAVQSWGMLNQPTISLGRYSTMAIQTELRLHVLRS